MISEALVTACQVYGIALAISMFVAVLIKILVAVTGKVSVKASAVPVPAPKAVQASPEPAGDIPEDVVAAISAAVYSVVGPHRIIHVAESSHSWSSMGRAAQHVHRVAR